MGFEETGASHELWSGIVQSQSAFGGHKYFTLSPRGLHKSATRKSEIV